MRRLTGLICLLMTNIASILAQYPTNGINPNWIPLDTVSWKIGDYVCNLYRDNSNGELCAQIITYLGINKKEVKIPERLKYEGKTYIVRDVSFVANGVNHVSLPSSVRVLSRFSGAKSLSFSKGSELRTISDNAFKFNQEIETVFLGSQKNLDSIGCSAFEKCANLRMIILPRYIKSIKSRAFACCEKLHAVMWSKDLYPNGQIPLSVVDSSIKRIEKGTFLGCSSLTTLEIPGYSNLSIDEAAFAYCTNLKSLKVPYIGDYIGDSSFRDCKSLQTLTWKKGKEGEIDLSCAKYIGKNAFENCSLINEITINADTIAEEAFYSCSSLKSVFISEKVKSIGLNAFSNCSALQSVCCLSTKIDFGGDPRWTFSNSNNLNGVNEIALSFNYFAKSRISKEIEKWRMKKEYETTAQWKSRVTPENQEKKVAQLMESAKTEYIKQQAPNPLLKCAIDSYDADDEVYKLKAENINTYSKKSSVGNDFFQMPMGEPVYVFVKVPVSDAPVFKENFKDVIIEPTYCITKNYLGIASCKFTLNGKTYTSPTLYDDETANVKINLPPLEIDFGSRKKNDLVEDDTPIDNALDLNIPTGNTINKNCFAFIIGNEKYTQVAKVPYAQNDAKIFAEYCKTTLGLPEKNVKVYENATYGAMIGAMSDLQKITKAFKGDINVIFYYAGHGIPDEATGDSYLLPIDADGMKTEVCYPLDRLYRELGELGAKSVVAFLDACFSGAQRGNGMVVAARGVAVKAKSDRPTGNTIVFTAATDKQTAYPYDEKGHGMFTYYLLKKLHDTKGDCTLGELNSYICDEVTKQAVVTNGKEQTPVVLTSEGMLNNWQNIKLK